MWLLLVILTTKLVQFEIRNTSYLLDLLRQSFVVNNYEIFIQFEASLKLFFTPSYFYAGIVVGAIFIQLAQQKCHYMR